MATRADAIERLRSLKTDFGQLVHCIDQGDAVGAGKIARQILEGMKSHLDGIQSHFSADFAENRLPTLESDRSYVAGLERKLPAREDLDRLNRVTVNIARYLRVLERITTAVYPRSPMMWKIVARAYGLKLAAALAVVAVAIGGVALFRARAANRHGLVAKYYSGMELKPLAKEIREDTIDFNWGEGGPLNSWRRSEFSARWTGYIQIPRADKWEFFTHNDDGVRLYIADQLVINDWNRHRMAINRAELKLDAGYYPFRLEYFEHRNRAMLRLFWKAASEKKPSIIPKEAFVPSAAYLSKDAVRIETLDPSAVLYATREGSDRGPRSAKNGGKAAAAAEKPE
jgi:hypothetical protein